MDQIGKRRQADLKFQADLHGRTFEQRGGSPSGKVSEVPPEVQAEIDAHLRRRQEEKLREKQVNG
jgi:hypothetical protein